MAFYKENQLSQALDAANRALTIEPEAVKPEIVGLKGAILLGLKDYVGAERTLKQAIALAPDNGKFHLALAILYQRTGRHAAARTELQKARDSGISVPVEIQQTLSSP